MVALLINKRNAKIHERSQTDRPLLFANTWSMCLNHRWHDADRTVDTSPQKPAECKLSNEKGTWAIPRSPGVTTVSKAYGAITVSCVSPDGYAGTTSMESTTAGAAFGNILAGGIIGAAVDMSSGAAYKYPAQVIVPMAPPRFRRL